MKRIIFLIFGFVFLYASVSSAATVYLKNGNTVEGKILVWTPEYIKIDFYGVVLKYSLEEVEHIDDKDEGVVPIEPSRGKAVISGTEKIPAQIFEEVSGSVVVIVAQMPNGVSQGSGFIMDSSGVIATNFHVVAGAEEIEVRLKNGKRYQAAGIINYDIQRDICIIKIDAGNLPAARLGDSDNLGQAQRLITIGAPFGLDYSISDGLLSGIREMVGRKVLQFTAPISPGNSGGPLFNMQGEVIGVTTFVITGAQNLNFAVPVNDVKRLYSTPKYISMKEFVGRVSKAYSFYELALKALYVNDGKSVVEYVTKAVEADPEFLDAQILLGVVLGEAGLVDEAYALWNKILEKNPDNGMVHFFLGNSYADKGLLDKAITEFNRAITINPNYAPVYLNLAVVYGRKGRIDKEIELLKKAISIDPNLPAAHLSLGNGYYHKGLIDEGIKETQRAFMLNPYYGQAALNLSGMYCIKGEYELAAQYLDKAIALGMKDAEHAVGQLCLAKIAPYRKNEPMLFSQTEEATGLTDDEIVVLAEAGAQTMSLIKVANEALLSTPPNRDFAINNLEMALKTTIPHSRVYRVILKMIDIATHKR